MHFGSADSELQPGKVSVHLIPTIHSASTSLPSARQNVILLMFIPWSRESHLPMSGQGWNCSQALLGLPPWSKRGIYHSELGLSADGMSMQMEPKDNIYYAFPFWKLADFLKHIWLWPCLYAKSWPLRQRGVCHSLESRNLAGAVLKWKCQKVP